MENTIVKLVAAVLMLAAVMATPVSLRAGTFKAGAAASNVTPPLGGSLNGQMHERRSAQIHDELHARCLALENDGVRLAFVVVDSCMLPREVTDPAKAGILAATGIPIDHICISATHTHTAPTSAGVFQSEPDPAYRAFLISRIVDGVTRAVNNLEPALVGWGSADVPDELFNRRWFMKKEAIDPDPFGNRTDEVKMNPPAGNPNLLKPAGPTDPQVSFIAVKTPEGRPIALLANYSLHYVGMEGPNHVSADYYGFFARRIGDLLAQPDQDPPFVGIMSNGTSADVNNTNFYAQAIPQKPYAQMRKVAWHVADAVKAALDKTEFHDSATLAAARREIELGVRLPPPEEIIKARAIVGAAQAEGRAMQTLAEVYARETVLMADYPQKVPVVLQAFRIGALGVAQIPCEVFTQIGLDLKARSALKPSFTIELANGYNGYLPTEEHFKLGGYETWRARSSYLEIPSAEKVTATVLELLVEVARP